VSTSADINGGQYALTGSGLAEGDQYEASVVYTPDDATTGRNTGMSAQYVLDGGKVTFQQAVPFLTGGSKASGTLEGWLRAKGSSFSGDPVGDKVTIRVND
jgi:hypothetical protein